MSEKSKISREGTIFVFILLAAVLNITIEVVADFVTNFTIYIVMATILDVIGGFIIPIIIESKKFTPTRQGTRYVVYLVVVIVRTLFECGFLAYNYPVTLIIVFCIPIVAYIIAMFVSARIMFNKNWKAEKAKAAEETANNTLENQETIETIKN